MVEQRQITIAIPSSNRSDMTIDSFYDVYEDVRISEIVIVDDASDFEVFTKTGARVSSSAPDRFFPPPKKTSSTSQKPPDTSQKLFAMSPENFFWPPKVFVTSQKMLAGPPTFFMTSPTKLFCPPRLISIRKKVFSPPLAFFYTPPKIPVTPPALLFTPLEAFVMYPEVFVMSQKRFVTPPEVFFTAPELFFTTKKVRKTPYRALSALPGNRANPVLTRVSSDLHSPRQPLQHLRIHPHNAWRHKMAKNYYLPKDDSGKAELLEHLASRLPIYTDTLEVSAADIAQVAGVLSLQGRRPEGFASDMRVD